MNFMEIANSWWMYLLGALVTAFIMAGTTFFMMRSYKEGVRLNMDRKLLKKTIFNSAIFSLVPSISIFVGVFAIAGKLGFPLPWIRLSVVGALHYEGMAADTAMSLFGTTVLTSEIFVTVAFVMTLGIIWGSLFCLFGYKKYEQKVLSKISTEKKQNNKEKKGGFGSILFNAMFISMTSAFIASEFAKSVRPLEDTKVSPWTPAIVVLSAFLSMFILDILIKKFKMKWLESFSLGFSMIIGMAIAVILK